MAKKIDKNSRVPYQNKKDNEKKRIPAEENPELGVYSNTLQFADEETLKNTHIRNVVETAGTELKNEEQDLKTLDPLMLAKAISVYSHTANYYNDVSDVANTILLSPNVEIKVRDQYDSMHTVNRPIKESYLDGMEIRFRPKIKNTGAVTINVKCKIIEYNATTKANAVKEVSLGAKALKTADEKDLTAN
jgi:hypothetical protein